MQELPFHQRFNLEIEDQEVQRRFIVRIYNRIFNNLGGLFPDDPYGPAGTVASALGCRWNGTAYVDEYVDYNFSNCLQAVEAIYKYLIERNDLSCRAFEKMVSEIISQSENDLGIDWKEGRFHPRGAKLLDEALINENLKWLTDLKLNTIYDPFNKALNDYSESLRNSDRLKDVITDMYEALEATAKWVMDNDRELSRNTEKFISILNLSNQHTLILKQYVDYANANFRHAKAVTQSAVKISPLEAEHFIYLTGVFIRFAIRKKLNK
ncbi:MAG: hypothetical protein HY036_02880 [Nitrospirae bacterium]|nr:hypothetical protein [Nitrospirota bacterium]